MDKRVREVLDVLEREWRDDHRVEELAAMVNLCASRLEHLFKSVVNRSIREVIQTRRLEEAANLIATTHERISEVVYFVGFRDVPNFNHAFRRRFGMSPREYRNARGNVRWSGSVAGRTSVPQEAPIQND
jgi:AraC family transcriptional regulator of arabinose operon